MGRGDSKSARATEFSCHSISDLPRDILVKILLKLQSVKRILVCKCVCKSWNYLISDPEFAKLHFDQAEVYPLLRSWNSLYLVQPEICDSELRLGLCDRNHSVTDIDFKLDSIFELPSNSYAVNSCNGLLLLRFRSPDFELFAVCNPITGEFIYLPHHRKNNSIKYPVSCGLGFSSTSNQYKVIRMIRSLSSTSQDMIVELHVLGTESWKDMGLLTHPVHGSYPTYVNGFLYWSDDLLSSPIVSFDVENECFRSFFVKGVDNLDLFERASVGELGQELCVYGFHRSSAFHVWVMRDNCDEKTWTHVFSIDVPVPSFGRRLSPLQPMKFLKDGSFLMFDSRKIALICVDSRKNPFKYLKVCGIELPFVDAIAYIPSFVSLRHALSRQEANVNVLIHKPRFTGLEREGRDVYAVEESLYKFYSDLDPDLESDSDSDLDSDLDSDPDLDLDHLLLEAIHSDSDKDDDSEGGD